RGDNVFKGYVSGGERGLVVRDGWLHTGDLARRNADGTYSFTGLRKPMFTRNGFNVYPRELALAVAELPGVTAVRTSERRMDDGEPAIELEVRGDVTEDAVRDWCARRLSTYKQPTVIRVI